MAHVRNRRMWGDNLDNVVTKHPYCHLVIEHMQGGSEKIVPKKPSMENINYGEI